MSGLIVCSKSARVIRRRYPDARPGIESIRISVSSTSDRSHFAWMTALRIVWMTPPAQSRPGGSAGTC